MKALTLQRPWIAAFLLPTDPKRIENRKWKPPASIIGSRIALHSGLGWWPNAEHDVCDNWLSSAERDAWQANKATTGLFATAVVSGWVHSEGFDWAQPCTATELIDARASRWFLGPYAWVLTDFVSFEPIPCKGAQGLWNLPDDVLAQMPESAR